jgi:hypothetical protein
VAAKVAWVEGLVAEDGCHDRHQLVVSGVWVLLFVGCVVVWGGKDVDSGTGCRDSVGFFSVVEILRAVWERRLDNL